MKFFKTFTNLALISGSLLGVSVLGFADNAAAKPETLVTCGPNGAAYIVEVVPAGCRHLSATSAPNHSPDNRVVRSTLNFTFTASETESQSKDIVTTVPESEQAQVPVALW